MLQLICVLPSEFDTTAALINQSLTSWDTTCSMIQLEYKRQHARESHSPTEIAATIDNEQPPDPPLRQDALAHRGRPNHQPRNSNHYPNTSGSRDRLPNQPPSHPQNRSSNQHRCKSSYSHQRPLWSAYPPPYWTTPYWASPPPCPYPTQGSWAAPWGPLQVLLSSPHDNIKPTLRRSIHWNQ